MLFNQVMTLKVMLPISPAVIMLDDRQLGFITRSLIRIVLFYIYFIHNISLHIEVSGSVVLSVSSGQSI